MSERPNSPKRPADRSTAPPELSQRIAAHRARLAANQDQPPAAPAAPRSLPEDRPAPPRSATSTAAPNTVNNTETAAADSEAVATRGIRLGTAFLIFLATLLGSLIGAAADLSGAIDTINQVQRTFAPTLCVVGSNTILGDGIPMASEWEAEFERDNLINVAIRGIGSVRGVEEAITGGCVHLLAMSEPMTAPQHANLTAAGVEIDCAAEIGYDVVAFITDINNDTDAVRSIDLSRILRGAITNWSEVGGDDRPITILARPGSGTTELILNNLGRWIDPNPADSSYFPVTANYVACASNGDCLDRTLATPGSLYWVSTAWMRTQPPQYLRIIPIVRRDEFAVNPLMDDVDLDNYLSALVRPLYMYVLSSDSIPAESNASARDFLRYVRGVRGQQILERHHFFTYFNQLSQVETVFPPEFEVGDDGLRPVCRN